MIVPRVHPLGDAGFTIELGQQRSAELLSRIHSAAAQIARAEIDSVQDVVPAYLGLTVFYDPLRNSFAQISTQVLDVLAKRSDSQRPESVTHHIIPVRYDGMDLNAVASACGITAADVISLHSGRTYTVDLLGFVPGWAYLSELDPRLQIERRPQPRPRVAAGSVAIAATQTGIYPLDTPGGWHIIGKTDTVMFDAQRDPPTLLKAGDTVQFESVRVS
ncbi:MAG TPA: 5-oxoprolinase subunit PxpB [Gemmatimonadaceae bacterium]|nr:5-oxoprolinase subunit PxpB [Gemmatimonadaceae bacterium]